MSHFRLHPSASQRLTQVIAAVKDHPDYKITVHELVSIIGRRAFATIIITFSLFNVLPIAIIPGVSLITGIPITYVAIQLLMGRSYLWLPNYIAHKSLPASKIVTIINKAMPFFKKVEFILRPRLQFMFAKPGIFIFAVFLFVLSIILMLPVPFSNNILGGLLILMALSLLEYDGALLCATYLLAITYFCIIWQVGNFILHIFTGK